MSERADLPLGTVVEFFQNKEISVGLVLGTKDNRVFVLSENNKELNLSMGRILKTKGPVLNHQENRDNLLSKLKEIGILREEIAKNIDLEELWSLLEGEEGGYSLKELAEFLFNEASFNHLAALERVLIRDRFYFQNRDNLFYPRTREEVEALKDQALKAEEKERKLQEESLWLKEVYKGEIPENLTKAEEIIEKLIDFCLRGDESEHCGYIKELFKRAEINYDPQLAFQILVKLGVWKEDENLFIRKFDIPREFPEEVTKYIQQKDFEHMEDPLDRYRKDMTHLWTISIDSEETKDIDDAISIEQIDNATFKIGVHITDVTSCIQKGDPVDSEARVRMTSIYLPDEKIPMIPPYISENLCSLVANQKRRAISFLFTVTEEGKVIEEEIVPSFIEVKERLTYEEATKRIEKDQRLKLLFKISSSFREARKSKGAIIVQVPEVYALVDDKGVIHLKRYDREEESQVIVSELMIAANALGAKFFLGKNIPALYRNQAETKLEEETFEWANELFRSIRQRRSFARAEISTNPERHCGLGVGCYTSLTSPLRRYMDLVLQRQLRSYFLGESYPYSVEDLEDIITEMNNVLPKVFFMSKKWNRYWILKYLKQENIKEAEALIIDQNERIFHAVLPDYMLEVAIPKRILSNISPGHTVNVNIEKVAPREDTIRITLPRGSMKSKGG